MRVGILTSVHPPMDTRIYFKQARSLAHEGHDVYLVARAGGDPREVHYVPVPLPHTRRARARTVMQVMWQAVKLRCDVYHVHDPELLPASVLIKFLTRGKLVYDVHENVREQIHNKYWIWPRLRGAVAALYGLAERICLRWVDHVVLAEDSYRDSYRHRAVTVVRNYPLLPPAATSPQPRTYSDRPILGYCGVVAEIRGALEMIEVLAALRKQCPRAELRIIGPCLPGELSERIRARAEGLRVSDGVRLFGRMPLDRALEEIAECDIGLALLHPDPNYVGSLPTKMFEYMSLRLPVVVSDFPLWSSIVRGSASGMAVDPFDTAGIAIRISTLCRDPQEMRRLGENGRQAVLAKYSWAAEEEKLLAVYDSLQGRVRKQRHESPVDKARSTEHSLVEAGRSK